MRVCLFRAFPDPYRASMQVWADQLLRWIPPLMAEGERLVDRGLPNASLNGRGRRYWDQYVRYQGFARQNGGDVNHVIDHGYGHLVRALPRHRTIVTFHDATVVKTARVGLGTRLSLRYSLAAMRGAAAVLAVSESSRADFLDLVDYPAERVTVVYPGVDPAFRPAGARQVTRRQYGVADDAVVVLHVGHTQPYMNVEAVIRVCGRLARRQRLDVRLVKVGDAFTADQKRLIAECGLAERVTHLGFVPAAMLPAIYEAADVLLYPVWYAGFGLPPVEAMACGTPVVCSNRGSLAEVVGDAAILVEPEAEDQIAVEVAGLLGNPARTETQRQRGFTRASHFTWARTAEAVLGTYRRVAAESWPAKS